MKGVEQIEHTLHNLASPKRGHTFWGWVGVLTAACLILAIHHKDLLSAPNEVMIGNSSDGFKNYMTSVWNVKRDSGYVHYDGMSYPFGDHVLFTDNQPILCAAMKWWSRHVSDVSDQVVGVIHLTLLLSMVFGAGVIFLLLRKLHLPVWYAGVAALGIAFLSPQYGRFDGHFGLSHIWVLPMILLLLCRYEERQSRRYQSLLIAILVWFSAQLHFYNLGVATIFLGFYTVFQILINRTWRNAWTRLSHFTVMALLPFAVLNVWLHWSDYCPDRSAFPYGFTDYIGRWEGVFLPYEYFPMHQWINEHITKIRGLDFEAQNYVGLVAFVFTLWLMFKRRFRLFDTSWDAAAYHRVHKNYLRGIAFAALATLIFSLGFPFSIKGFEWMIDYLGPFKQFRGLGRFTWAFYYVINVLAFYILWNKSQRIQISDKWISALKTRFEWGAQNLPNLAKWSMLWIPLVVLSWEAYVFQKNNVMGLVPSFAQRKAVASSPDHWLNKVDFARFQSLMPLPYYHSGSENLWLVEYYPLFQKVQYTAFHTGVPDMGVKLSRTAISRMVKSMQFSLLACEPPTLLSELPDNRPIALLIEPNFWEAVQKNYPHLVDKATTVYQGPELRIMSLVPDSVRTWSQQEARAVLAEINSAANTDIGAGFRSDAPSKWYKALQFDSITTSQHIFKGKGGGEGNLRDTTWIWKDPVPKGSYTFSIWIKVDEDMGMTQGVQFLEKSLTGEQTIQFRKEDLRSGVKTIVNGWALFELPFEVEQDQSRFEIFLLKKNTNTLFWYDEVLIKDKNLHLYRSEPGWVMRDNYWYKLPKN